MAQQWTSGYIRNATTTFAKIFEPTAGYTASVNGFQVTNKTTASVEFFVDIYPLSAAGNNVSWVPGITLTGKQIWEFDGVRILLNTDEVWLRADTTGAVDAHITAINDNSVST